MNIEVAMELILKGIAAVNVLSTAYQKAKAEGRTTLTPEEVAAFRSQDDAVAAQLQAEIDRQKKAP